MTQIQPDDFSGYLTDEEAWDTANSLLVDYFGFSKVSNLRNRAYGVKVVSNTKIDPETNVVEEDNDYVNECLRQAIWRQLYTVQSETERKIGFGLSPRYRVDKINFPRSGKFYYPQAGVESINVGRTWSTLAGYDAIAVNNFVIESATVDVVGDQAFVRLPVDVVFNPEDVIIRDENNSAFTIDQSEPITRVGAATDYWRVPISTHTKKYDVLLDTNVQSMRYIYVDITPPTVPAGGTLVPVYVGTNQIIPQYKDFEILSGGDYRFWFPVHVLVHPDFRFDRAISLIDAEFYKLYQTVEFRYYEEITVYPELEVTAIVDGVNTVTTYQFDPLAATNVTYPEISLIDKESGLSHFIFNDTACDSLDPFTLFPNADVRDPISVRLVISYKTSPTCMSDKYRYQLSGIQRLIAQKVASELPLVDCGCMISKGFIAQQQTGYTEEYMNPFTGTSVSKFAYGNLHGQVAYHEFMSQADLYRKPIFLG